MNKRTFVKNTAVMTVTSLLLRTLGIVFRIFISNRIGAEGMGLYQLVFSVYVLGTTFAAAGLNTAVTRMAAEQLIRGNNAAARRILRTAVWLCILIGGISAVILSFSASLIGGLIGDPRTVPAVRVSGIALPVIGVSGCLKAYFMARRRAGTPCIAQIIEQITRIGGILLMLGAAGEGCPLERSCRILILGDALAETVAFLYLWIAYRVDKRRLPADRSLPVPAVVRPMLTIAVPLTAGRYLSTALRTVENVLVPARLTVFTRSDALSLEQFGAVKGMALPLLFFPAAFLVTVSGLLIPELSDAKALGHRRQVALLTDRAMRLTTLGAVLIGCLFTVFGRPLGEMLYGDASVGLFLQILGPLTPIMYLDSVATAMLKGLGEQMRSLWYGVADSAVRLVLIWVLVPRYGITGFLFVMLVSNILTCVLSVQRLLRVGGVTVRWFSRIVLPVIIAVLCGGGFAALRSLLPLPAGWGTLIAGAVGITGGYLLLLPLFGCVGYREIANLFRLRRRSTPAHL